MWITRTLWISRTSGIAQRSGGDPLAQVALRLRRLDVHDHVRPPQRVRHRILDLVGQRMRLGHADVRRHADYESTKSCPAA